MSFERQHGVSLPADYRAFLRLAGNGGAGPSYGVPSLQEAAASESLEDLAKPALLRPDMPRGVSYAKALGCEFEAVFQGTLTICVQGCTYAGLLVLSGPHRGRVVYIDEEWTFPPYFTHDAGFLAWYERWLDETLAGYDTAWFGFGLPGAEDDLIAALTSAATDTQAEALQTLWRIPALRPSSLEAVRTATRSDASAVRKAAIAVLRKYPSPESVEPLRRLTRDGDAAVRAAAHRAILEMPGVPVEAIAREAMSDVSPEVVRTGLYYLVRANDLRAGDLTPLFASPNPQLRIIALGDVGSVPSADRLSIPPSLVSDADLDTRTYAIRAVGRIRDRAALPALREQVRVETDLTALSALATTFGRLGDPAALPDLIALTRHQDGFVRLDAAQALGELGDARAIPALEALLSDRTSPVRQEMYNDVPITRMTTIHTVASVARASLVKLGHGFWRRMVRRWGLVAGIRPQAPDE